MKKSTFLPSPVSTEVMEKPVSEDQRKLLAELPNVSLWSTLKKLKRENM